MDQQTRMEIMVQRRKRNSKPRKTKERIDRKQKRVCKIETDVVLVIDVGLV